MTDLDKYLKMLKSPKASVRYDAYEELRVATESSPEVILALEEAAQDEDVADTAKEALSAEVHYQMAINLGRISLTLENGLEPIIEQKPEKLTKTPHQLAVISTIYSLIGSIFTWVPSFCVV